MQNLSQRRDDAPPCRHEHLMYDFLSSYHHQPYLVCDLVEDLVGHDGGDGAADLVVARHVDVVGPGRPQQDVEEARRHRHLRQVAQRARLAQTDECRERPLEAVQLPHLDYWMVTQ